MSLIEIFPWNKYFDVGIDEIDTQHRVIVSIINKICTCVSSNENYNELIDTLFTELHDYIQFHFDSEEKLFAHHLDKHEIYQEHRKEHDDFVLSLITLKKKYDLDRDDHLLEDILTQLVNWLANHILFNDTRLCIIIINMDRGDTFEDALEIANVEMQGRRGAIVDTMNSMVEVSSVRVLELRREVDFRKKLEIKLLQTQREIKGYLEESQSARQNLEHKSIELSNLAENATILNKQLKKEISTRKSIEKKLKFLAQHDPLTGLPNRRLLDELLSSAIKAAKRRETTEGLLFIDIDGFKEVNDTMGHHAGDDLLITIARRLEQCVRESDMVARVGGDEFIVYLADISESQDAQSVASKIASSIVEPFNLSEGVATVSASVGISLYPADGQNVVDLIQKADQAMYLAKSLGKNRYKFASECNNKH